MIFTKKYMQSIIALIGAIMLFSCRNDMEKVSKFGDIKDLPAMSGENMYLIYSDSARIKYKVITPLYYKINKEDEQYDEFPEGIHVISYDKEGKIEGEITSKYAKNIASKNLWEARHEVIIINAEGAKMETELLYWDMEKAEIYTDRYSRLTMNGSVIEGNNGFVSDQNLHNIIFKNVTGEVEFQQ